MNKTFTIQEAHLKKCLTDPVYFITKYIIMYHQSMSFDVSELMNQYSNHNNNLVKDIGARVDITTIAYILHYALTHPYRTIVITAPTDKEAVQLLNLVKVMHNDLPDFIKDLFTIHRHTKHDIEFDSGTRIRASAVTSCCTRGMSISFLYCHNLSEVKTNLQEEFWTGTWPALSYLHGKCILTSSNPTSVDVFSTVWDNANLGLNDFNTIEI